MYHTLNTRARTFPAGDLDGTSTWRLSVLTLQFFCTLKTALKHEGVWRNIDRKVRQRNPRVRLMPVVNAVIKLAIFAVSSGHSVLETGVLPLLITVNKTVSPLGSSKWEFGSIS